MVSLELVSFVFVKEAVHFYKYLNYACSFCAYRQHYSDVLFARVYVPTQFFALILIKDLFLLFGEFRRHYFLCRKLVNRLELQVSFSNRFFFFNVSHLSNVFCYRRRNIILIGAHY